MVTKEFSNTKAEVINRQTNMETPEYLRVKYIRRTVKEPRIEENNLIARYGVFEGNLSPIESNWKSPLNPHKYDTASNNILASGG